MIRPFTILCFCAFAGAGAWLYQVKHQVATQDRELREVWRQIEVARDRTSILRAEWALLNEPGRLREVAQRHLPLEQMQPQQFTRLPDMVRRLPQAVAFAGSPNLFVPERPAQESPAAGVMLAAAQTPAPATPAAAPRAAAPAVTPA
ncbi:MAG: ABC transporter permease, partial [Falsiroseomonas sp.]|nr:ABC transporter permease [Falsiroseomonas sp.]